MQRIHKTISEFLEDRRLPTVSSGDTVLVAIEVMKAHDSSCVVVVEDEVAVGIFTGRDFLMRVVGSERGPSEILIREVMTADPETLESGHCVSFAINIMTLGGFRHVPIVNEGKAVSLLGVRDVVAHLSEVFAELAERPVDPAFTWDWVDIGGQG